MKELAVVLDFTLKDVTTKYVQTIGLLERSQASIKQALKIGTGERRSLWLVYVSIAVPNYNTSYHTSIGCEPSRIFHGRIRYNSLDTKLGRRPQQAPILTSQIAQDVFDTDDPPRCSQECYASRHQIQNLLRQKGQCFKAQTSVCLTAKSRSSKE